MKPVWYVMGKGKPQYKHASQQSTENEAARLARLNPGDVFCVLELKAVVVKRDVEIHRPDDKEDTDLPF